MSELQSAKETVSEEASQSILSETRIMALAGVGARVLNAGLLFLTQILFARSMGVTEFGIYATANTWMLLMAGVSYLGLTAMPQRFLPEYELAKDTSRLRGLVHFASYGPLVIGSTFSLVGIAIAILAKDIISAPVATTTSIALLIVPALVSISVVEGLALAKAWKGLAYGISFVIRPLMTPVIFGTIWLSGAKPDASLAMLSMAAAAWIACALLLVLIRRRFKKILPEGPRIEEHSRWIRAGLPVMLIDGAFMLMTSTDIILLSFFQTEAEVGTYSAAARLVALVAFVHYGLTWASGHHFSSLHVSGKKDELAHYAARTTRWTFLPSLVVAGLVALAAPYLLLAFGPAFSQGAGITAVLLLGLLARAAIGPAEQLLIMTDNQLRCARAYAAAFVVNLSCCLALIPAYGGTGAAIATAIAYVAASIIIAWQVHKALGFHVHVLALFRRSGNRATHV